MIPFIMCCPTWGSPYKSVLQEVCQFLKSQLDPGSVDSLFFAAETSKAISGCEVWIIILLIYIPHTSLVIVLLTTQHG